MVTGGSFPVQIEFIFERYSLDLIRLLPRSTAVIVYDVMIDGGKKHRYHKIHILFLFFDARR